MRRAYADTPEGQVHYVTEGSGMPVLLLPSAPRSCGDFVRMMPILVAKGRRVIAVDTLGFGMSDKPARPYEIGDLAENLVHFLDSLGISTTDVMGISTGAGIASNLAARWPERVRRLVLMGLQYWLSTEERLAFLEKMKQPRSVELETPDIDGSHLTRVWGRATKRVQEGGESELSEDDLDWMSDYTMDALSAGLYWKETYLALTRYDARPMLPLIKAPTLVIGIIGGGGNKAANTNRPQEVQALIPQSRIGNIQGADARAKYARAEELAEEVGTFFDSATP